MALLKQLPLSAEQGMNSGITLDYHRIVSVTYDILRQKLVVTVMSYLNADVRQLNGSGGWSTQHEFAMTPAEYDVVVSPRETAYAKLLATEIFTGATNG